jgi:hypothetical protein
MCWACSGEGQWARLLSGPGGLHAAHMLAHLPPRLAAALPTPPTRRRPANPPLPPQLPHPLGPVRATGVQLLHRHLCLHLRNHAHMEAAAPPAPRHGLAQHRGVC